MDYGKLFRYLIMIMVGGLGFFNSYKLEIRYETNTNLELLCQNGMIISTLIIIYFTLAFFIEILISKRRKKIIKQTSTKKPEWVKTAENVLKGEEE